MLWVLRYTNYGSQLGSFVRRPMPELQKKGNGITSQLMRRRGANMATQHNGRQTWHMAIKKPRTPRAGILDTQIHQITWYPATQQLHRPICGHETSGSKSRSNPMDKFHGGKNLNRDTHSAKHCPRMLTIKTNHRKLGKATNFPDPPVISCSMGLPQCIPPRQSSRVSSEARTTQGAARNRSASRNRPFQYSHRQPISTRNGFLLLTIRNIRRTILLALCHESGNDSRATGLTQESSNIIKHPPTTSTAADPDFYPHYWHANAQYHNKPALPRTIISHAPTQHHFLHADTNGVSRGT